MKKLLSIVLAMAMVLALGVTAFADDTWEGNTENNANEFAGTVTATYTDAEDAASAGNIYSVKLTWTDVSVAYAGAVAGIYKWNPTSLKYELVENSNKTAQWTDASIAIAVENRSNASITATATYDKVGDEVLTFDNGGSVVLTTAAVNGGSVIAITDTTTMGTAQTGTITGTMDGSIAASGELGTITITLTHD